MLYLNFVDFQCKVIIMPIICPILKVSSSLDNSDKRIVLIFHRCASCENRKTNSTWSERNWLYIGL